MSIGRFNRFRSLGRGSTSNIGLFYDCRCCVTCQSCGLVLENVRSGNKGDGMVLRHPVTRKLMMCENSGKYFEMPTFPLKEIQVDASAKNS